MPIYEYCCQDCGHSLEAIQKLADEPLTDCPECGKPALKKQVSAPTFRLSGGGWYETDFKTGDKKNIAGEMGARSSQPAKRRADMTVDPLERLNQKMNPPVPIH